MRRLAYRISIWNQAKLDLTEQERQVTEYGMEIFLDGIFKLLVLFGIGAAIGKTAEFALFLAAFCGLRSWAGGVHCRTAGRCTAAMAGLCLAGLSGEWILGKFPVWITVFLWIGCMFILLIKAPGETGKDGYFPADERRRRKQKALLCGTILGVCFVLAPSVSWKGSILAAVTAETLSILPCKGNKYSTEEEKEKTNEKTGQAGSDGKRDCGMLRQKCGE